MSNKREEKRRGKWLGKNRRSEAKEKQTATGKKGNRQDRIIDFDLLCPRNIVEPLGCDATVTWTS